MHSPLGDRRQLRASDADRDAVVAQLRHHGSVGRLTVDELTERIGQALDAKTLGQLDDLLTDLPRDDASLEAALSSSTPAPSPVNVWRLPRVRARAIRLALLNAFVLLGWGFGGHGHGGFLPALVLVASVALMARTASRAAARAERERRRATRTRTPPPYLGR